MLNSSNFAETLNELMLEQEINAPALAKNIGINRTTVTRYLTGNYMPSVKNLVAIADYFGCSAEFLLGFSDDTSFGNFKKCPPFGERLTFLLDYFNTNKYQLQKRTKIAESAIYDWQRGDNFPSLDAVIKIAEALGCSVDFVLGRSNN